MVPEFFNNLINIIQNSEDFSNIKFQDSLEESEDQTPHNFICKAQHSAAHFAQLCALQVGKYFGFWCPHLLGDWPHFTECKMLYLLIPWSFTLFSSFNYCFSFKVQLNSNSLHENKLSLKRPNYVLYCCKKPWNVYHWLNMEWVLFQYLQLLDPMRAEFSLLGPS